MSIADARSVCKAGSNRSFGTLDHEADKVMCHYPSSEMNAAWRGCLADAERQLSACFLSCRPVVLLLRCMYSVPRGLGGGCTWDWTDIAQGPLSLGLDAPCYQHTTAFCMWCIRVQSTRAFWGQVGIETGVEQRVRTLRLLFVIYKMNNMYNPLS